MAGRSYEISNLFLKEISNLMEVFKLKDKKSLILTNLERHEYLKF